MYISKLTGDVRETPALMVHQKNGAILRLFCFPYAGGGAAAFRMWPAFLPDTVEVCGVQPPGRENCIGEEPIADVFENHDNSMSHYLSTGPEIWENMNGHVDVFVSGLGSGGTLMGTGKYLKEKNPEIMIVAVEPKNASALLGHEPGLHKIEGIGDGFVPSIVDTSLIDKIIEVDDDSAVEMTRRLASKQGFLVGISSGANVCAALEMRHLFGKDKNIATIFPDGAERYFSTALFADRYQELAVPYSFCRRTAIKNRDLCLMQAPNTRSAGCWRDDGVRRKKTVGPITECRIQVFIRIS